MMGKIDKIHMIYPFMGSRRIRDELEEDGEKIVNRKRIQRLLRRMGIQALYPKAKTTIPDSNHKIYPYLLNGLDINRPNQVWCTDITYIPMGKGSLYLVAVMDWSSRKVLSWRLSNTMDRSFCIEALEESFKKYGKPEIFNTDQGSQFTSDEFTSLLKANDVKISMDSKGRWMDNVFIERLWRSLKYEDVYLKAYENPIIARREIGKWFNFYNQRRKHQSLNRKAPDQVYFNGLPRPISEAC